jgi:hypothetical protein
MNMTKLSYAFSTLLLFFSTSAYSATPYITLNGSSDTTIHVHSNFQDPGAIAYDAEDGYITNSITISGSLNTSLVGVYTIRYRIVDSHGNRDSIIRIVHVTDTIIPVIVNISAYLYGNCWVVPIQMQSAFTDITTATDNYYSLTNGLTLTANPAAINGRADVDTRFQGTTTVLYTASDSSGNTATQCIDYFVRDYIAPVIDLRTLDIINHCVGSAYTPIIPVATDNLYNTSQISLVLSSSDVDGFTLGTYHEVYTAADPAGNTSTKIRTVIVAEDCKKPVISAKNGDEVQILINSTYDPADYIVLSDDYDHPDSLRKSLVVLFNDVDVTTIGMYSTVFQVTDLSGNISNEFTLIIEVVASLSTSELAASNPINIYPNPTSDNITIQMMSGEVIDEITLHTLHGDELKHVTVYNSKTVLNLSPYTTGIYLLTIFSEGHKSTRRITLE